jgi:hypothetical protein
VSTRVSSYAVSRPPPGAAKPAKAERPRASLVRKMREGYWQVPVVTRGYMTLLGVVTLLGLVLGPQLLVLDARRTVRNLELWRPITAAAFLGPPSLGWLSSAYMLYQNGQCRAGQVWRQEMVTAVVDGCNRGDAREDGWQCPAGG